MLCKTDCWCDEKKVLVLAWNLLLNFEVDVWRSDDNFGFALSSCFNNLKRDNTTTMAPKLGSFNLVFHKLSGNATFLLSSRATGFLVY